ncbi:S-adenosyl-L-methionine-dependent methyltransferase [Hypoxylon fragiforme]|uniref:S-adenosyl-L-methionine-dependent methyltransferase n=1 Tax=Hypoxylon fragiforme TaxID=63214 RepID=UPI0020C6AC59|nr:S-adenosyl-L-methionine-dependent methyltransferase [Hypoxylon fragiforme]KAI2605364.1 S-adenosyl-L-methionine-dependent methyltransferase [Hypoxylon fragiforme]
MADEPTTTAVSAAAATGSNPPVTHHYGEPQAALVAAPDSEGDEDEDADADSALGSDAASSTNSITASILEYRTIQGRTFHSEKHNSKYFTPNDEQQLQSVDITHHYLTMLIGDKLHLAPISDDVQKVLDIGTGSGIWAIDFADQYTNAEVVGTDLSPTQPLWVPPNVKFEIDDCTQPWTWAPNTFDFVHMRYLFGAIADWDELLRQAFRVTTPGGWVQSCEADVDILSDDGTIPPDSAYERFWNHLYRNASRKIGASFQPIEQNVQIKAFERAGFEDIHEQSYKFPVGGWPADKKLAEVGQYVQLTMLNDVEGYTLFLWNQIMGENAPGYQEYLAVMRAELKNRRMHGYMRCRYVWGRKPASATSE